MGDPTVYLFVHVICTVQGREPLLSKPVRRVLFTHLQKEGEEKGIRISAANGVEDHIHLLIQLMPAQNLTQVVRNVRASSAQWVNENRLLNVPFAWDEAYYALSVSPSSVRQTRDYIEKQEEHHRTKSLDGELDAFTRLKEQI